MSRDEARLVDGASRVFGPEGVERILSLNPDPFNRPEYGRVPARVRRRKQRRRLGGEPPRRHLPLVDRGVLRNSVIPRVTHKPLCGAYKVPDFRHA